MNIRDLIRHKGWQEGRKEEIQQVASNMFQNDPPTPGPIRPTDPLPPNFT